MTKMKFELGDHVRIHSGAENGGIIGRAEYVNTCNNYLVRYVAGDGRAIESWWAEDALELVAANLTLVEG